MISNAKLNGKNKPAKSSAKKAKDPGKLQSVEDKVSGDKSISEKRIVIDAALGIDTALGIESAILDLKDDADEYLGNELYTLRYDINEKGIGKILLPPSLSTLLQSDRVCISPTAGGLFIKSL